MWFRKKVRIVVGDTWCTLFLSQFFSMFDNFLCLCLPFSLVWT
jgi:hypothetical protein